MVDRWVLVDDQTHEVHPEGFETQKDAWRAAVELARAAKRSPYEWTMYKVEIPVR